MRVDLIVAICSVVAGLSGLAGCGSIDEARGDSPSPAAAAAPNMLVVVLDAVRADRVGCYGYERRTTPTIDALALDPDAVLYRRHHVQGAYTKSSTASLFTGLFVFQHNVILGDVVREVRPGYYPEQALSGRFETAAERFKDLGYRTFAVVKSHHLDPEFGFDQGFDEYFGPDDVRSDLARVAKTLKLIERSPGPFFGYLHLAASHHPFPPESRHAGYMQEYGYRQGLIYDEQKRMAQGVDFTTPETKHLILDGEVTLSPDDVAFLNLVYEAELRLTDDHVHLLVEVLKQLNRYDDTLLVVTADHGEELYDHGGYAHGHALWEEIIHVPLIVKFPRGTRPEALGRQVDEVTESIDLLPSLLAVAGAGADERLPGSDIFEGSSRGFAYSETRKEFTLVEGGYKLIDGGAETRLFNLDADPLEHENLAASEPRRLEAMRVTAAALRDHVAFKPVDAPVQEMELSEEAVRALRSLGYIR